MSSYNEEVRRLLLSVSSDGREDCQFEFELDKPDATVTGRVHMTSNLYFVVAVGLAPIVDEFVLVKYDRVKSIKILV